MKRSSGVLLPIFSLPNDFGIGSFGQAAYDFVDFLKESGQSYWQILPLSPTSYGDSPYSSFSAFAGNTHFIDLDLLAKAAYLKAEDYQDVDFGSDPEQIDYEKIYYNRRPILELAVDNFLKKPSTDYQNFLKEEEEWIHDYSHFMALKEHFDSIALSQWPDAIRKRKPAELSHLLNQVQDSVSYHQVCQYFFYQQWQALKTYANQAGIKIIGDVPIYISADSCEMWTHPELFKVDKNLQPSLAAGVPPDAFSADGQLWGNPLYHWKNHRKDGYQWWIWRMKASLKMYDVIRIDHFRGFEAYWQVPAGHKTARKGKWVKGPGLELFEAIQAALGDLDIIAEDLGVITPEVEAIRDEAGFPGMRVMQFAFGGDDSPHLPHNYIQHSVAYAGTHDNQTTRGWLESIDRKSLQRARTYLKPAPGENLVQAINRALAASSSHLVIYMMQDLLNLDDRARINQPATIGKNWQWRMKAEALNPKVSRELRKLTKTYFR